MPRIRATVLKTRGPAGTEVLTAQAIAERVKERITRGVYAPGQRLIEGDLATEFGIGRSRVRETLKTLVGEGYLEFIENRGVRVRRQSRKDAWETGRVREVLEGLAVRETIENGLTGEDKKQLGVLQKQLNAAFAAGDLERYNEYSAQFHEFFISRSANQLLQRLLDRFRIPLARIQFRDLLAQQDVMQGRHDCVRRVTAAALAGDAAAAEAEMRNYIDKGNRKLLEVADEFFE
jgi:DNA-binding GntR family transcriptional regulator